MELVGAKEGSSLVFIRDFQDGKSKTIRYDFKDDSFYSETKLGNWRKVDSVTSFFSKLTPYDVINSFTDDKYKEFLRAVYKAAPNRLKSMASMMQYVSMLKHIESYIALGIKFDTPSIYVGRKYWEDKTPKLSGISEPVSFYQKDVIEFMKEGDFRISRAWEVAYREHKELFINLIRHVRKNYFRDLEVYVWAKNLLENDYRRNQFKSLINDYNLEYKTAFSYLVEVDRREALSFLNALQYHSDYIRMNNQMRNTRASRYPDNLTMRHNITARNYNVRVADYDIDLFKAGVDYNLEWMEGDWAVVAPQNPEEMKTEGNKLHHCVGSYITKVINGTCQILFLRFLPEGNDPLVTIEISQGRIVQYRGENNRYPSEEQIEVIYKYAKAKRLHFKDYDPTKDKEKDAKKEGEENSSSKDLTNEQGLV